VSVRRRGNGLTAESYVLLLDVDPRLADALLAALATAGVAAYTTPTTGRVGPFLEMHPPSRPLEAVHVDSTRRPDARRVLETTMPDVTVGLPSVKEEDEFAALIAGWDDEPDSRPWPTAEDLDSTPRRPGGPVDLAGGPPRRRRTDLQPDESTAEAPAPQADEPAGAPPAEPAAPVRAEVRGNSADLADDPAADPDDDLGERYEPPPLADLPPSHPVTKWGLVALGLGLVLLLFPMLLGLEHTTAVDVAGVLCVLGAVGLLVSRLSGRSTDDYDGPDDGAVV
jgi:hypothetical protein